VQLNPVGLPYRVCNANPNHRDARLVMETNRMGNRFVRLAYILLAQRVAAFRPSSAELTMPPV